MDELVRLSSKVSTTGDLTKVKPSVSKGDCDQWCGLLDGDVVAFERLMVSQYRALFHYGLKFTADQEFVRDTIQDLFLHVWERRESLNADIPPKPYLMASLRRMMNRSPLKSPLIPESLPNNFPALPSIEFSVEKNFIQRESARVLSQRLKSLLDELPLRQKGSNLPEILPESRPLPNCDGNGHRPANCLQLAANGSEKTQKILGQRI